MTNIYKEILYYPHLPAVKFVVRMVRFSLICNFRVKVGTIDI